MYKLQHYEDNYSVGVTQTEDLRDSNKVGTIGLATFTVKSDITQLTNNHIINHINKSLGFNVKQVAKNDFRGVRGVINSKIKKIELFSIDAILQPVKTRFVLQVEVFNPDGKCIFKDDFIGLHEETLGLSFSNKKEGRFVEAALINALDKLVEDSFFIYSLKRL